MVIIINFQLIVTSSTLVIRNSIIYIVLNYSLTNKPIINLIYIKLKLKIISLFNICSVKVLIKKNIKKKIKLI